MIECIKMMETRQLILISLLYIVFVLKTVTSLQEDQQSASTVIVPNRETCPQCYKQFHNLTYTSNHRMPFDLINTNETIQLANSANLSNRSRLVETGLDETNSRSIYASLMKILQQLKNQMKNNTQDSDGDSSDFAEAETIHVPLAVNELRRSDHDWSMKNLRSGDEKKINRVASKQSRGKKPPKYDTWTDVSFSRTDDENNQQEPASSKNPQLNINFDDNNSGNNIKKTSYSKYLGPTIDVTTKLRSDRKLNQLLNVDNNNWYPNEEYSSSLKQLDELGPSKQDTQPDSPVPVYTTPGTEYLSSSSTLAPLGEDASVYHPFKTSYSLPEVKQSLNQALRDTTVSTTTTTENPEPTILLVRKQRNPHKRYKSPTYHKSPASIRDSIHFGHQPASLEFNSPFEHQDSEPAHGTKSSSNFGEMDEQLFRQKSTHPLFLQQLDSRPATAHSSNLYSKGQYLQPQTSAATQKVYYTLTSIPQTDLLKTMPATASQLKSVLGTRSQRDLLNQPQTIQITSVPPNGALMRVNAANLGGLFGSGLDFSNLPSLSGLSGFPGRPVLMVNSDRRLDWSWIIWPVAVVVALPLILSALFVPVFLKSIIIFIQILQSLGLVFPPSGLAHHLTSGGSNLTSFN